MEEIGPMTHNRAGQGRAGQGRSSFAPLKEKRLAGLVREDAVRSTWLLPHYF